MPEPVTPVKPSPSRCLDSPLGPPDPLFASAAFSTPQPSPSAASAARFNPDDLLVSPPPPTSTPDLRRKLFATDALLTNAPPSSIRRHPCLTGLSPPPPPLPHSQPPVNHRLDHHFRHHSADHSGATNTPSATLNHNSEAPASDHPQPPLTTDPKPEPVSDSLPSSVTQPPQQKPPFQFTSTKCNCKASRCLKLYCPCFASSAVCAPTCTCQNCQNNPQTFPAVNKARSSVLSRDPRAFEPRVKAASAAPDIHTKGCNCRKGCSKKYCVCRELKVACGPRCTCSGPKGCQNGKNVQESTVTDPRQPAACAKKRNHIEQLTPPSPLHAIATSFSPGFPPLAALSPPLKLPDDPFDDLRDVITDPNDPLVSPDAIKTRNACSSFVPPVNRRIALDDDSFHDHSHLSLSVEPKPTHAFEPNHSNTPKNALKLHVMDLDSSPTTGIKPETPPSKFRTAFGSFRKSDKIEKYSRPRLPRILRVKMGTGRALKRFNI
ncbi:unnamed protein product [Agarophyton chilense]|eukprot:gb/GEZJ01002442.1/.p1 GENE.gb/GEZJ01002442.1/~~gb/GEZJ01002442.1/.p1  ORF type:complete len:506 (+),score=59.54 gb/GEZJ01002442.1/:46-1518(+)